jgi:hypothetical protein
MKRTLIQVAIVALATGLAGCAKQDKLPTKSALPKFQAMLQQAGVDTELPDPAKTWEVFKAFSSVPVQCADEGFLFECGVYNSQDKPMFHFNYVRQFSIEKHGEYDHLEQLHVDFHFEPTAELQGLKTNKWSSDFKTPEEFFKFVESLQEFRTIMNGGYKPAYAKMQQFVAD